MTNIQYKIDDMTGAPMDVKQWVDTEVSVGHFNLWRYSAVVSKEGETNSSHSRN